ncbi:unnamed protein product [Clonostachys byssicola]|uniref:Uncharacterized protein n=1 Tax=Clonostachys byssicola TaxID=160290 RepID=A0A9N9UBG4_9HYPO|nr:unnamed protein product [Clonostachys byssicola]
MAAQTILHVWALEFWSLAASLAQFAIMFALMVHFDGKQTFDGSFVTLNTITSILSTGSRASLLTGVSSCISQANWAAFATKPRRLYDFEMISEASRGPLGSVQLLLNSRFKGGPLVRFGAVLTLLSIATGPFAQQLVRVRQIDFLEEGGSIAQGLSYSKGISSPHYSFHYNPNGSVNVTSATVLCKPDISMRASLMFTLSADIRDVIRQATFECPGTGCLFQNFRSLAICSRCYDISSMLVAKQYMKIDSLSSGDQMEYSATKYSLPNGLYLENEDVSSDYPYSHTRWEPTRDVLSLYGTSNPNKSINSREIDTLIWSQSVIKVDNSTNIWQWPNMSVYAVECALYYCVKDYSFRVVNSSIELELEKERKEYRRHPDSWKLLLGNMESDIIANASRNLAFHPNQSAFRRSDLQLSRDFDKSEGFNISQSGVNTISSLVQDLFSSCLDKKGCPAAVDDWKPPTGYYSYQRAWDVMVYQPDLAPAMWSSENLTARFDSIAASMSNSLRSGDDLNSRFVGKVANPITVYKINWPWISYQLFIHVAAMVFFAISVSIDRQPGSRGIPVWKSSQLAVMSQGALVADVLKGAETLEELETAAKKTTIMLLANGEDRPLMQLGAGETTDETSLRGNSASD